MNTTLNKETQSLARVFSALGDTTRLQLIDLLKIRKNICVSELATELGISNSAVSQQMRYLELNGIVVRERNGQKICYQLSTESELLSELFAVIERNKHV